MWQEKRRVLLFFFKGSELQFLASQLKRHWLSNWVQLNNLSCCNTEHCSRLKGALRAKVKEISTQWAMLGVEQLHNTANALQQNYWIRRCTFWQGWDTTSLLPWFSTCTSVPLRRGRYVALLQSVYLEIVPLRVTMHQAETQLQICSYPPIYHLSSSYYSASSGKGPHMQAPQATSITPSIISNSRINCSWVAPMQAQQSLPLIWAFSVPGLARMF